MSEGRPRKGMSALEIAKLSEPDEKDIDYPTGIKLALLLMCIFVGMFLVSLASRSEPHSPSRRVGMIVD